MIRSTKNLKENTEWIFWTTIAIIFVLLEHNGTEPLFLIAYSLIPILILIFIYKKSYWSIVLYILFFGVFGRFTRYFRQGYMSDTLPVIKDFIGYFLQGKNIYKELVMSQTGPAPFIYLPFCILWYLPARILQIDLRLFETVISSFVPVVFLFYGFISNKWKALPLLAIISLTPFLLDLSSDGSNDNSAIFILLVSILFLAISRKYKSSKFAYLSAVVLGLSISFKHYVFFYLIFFILFLFKKKNFLPINFRKYFLSIFLTFAIITLPFIIASPSDFLKSLTYIEIGNKHPIWGWNIWNALKIMFNFNLSTQQMWLIRSLATGTTIAFLFFVAKLDKFNKVFMATVLAMLIYLIFSQWTTYAYFTFLVPLICLGAIDIEDKD